MAEARFAGELALVAALESAALLTDVRSFHLQKSGSKAAAFQELGRNISRLVLYPIQNRMSSDRFVRCGNRWLAVVDVARPDQVVIRDITTCIDLRAHYDFVTGFACGRVA